MPQKPHILDYEPVRRKGSARAVEFDPREETDSPVVPHSKSPNEMTTTSASPTAQAAATPPKTGMKKGHALTFVAMFIFTALVYFRPYEVFPSLKWTSSSAFWMGLATLLIYVPMQLQLEEKITIRPREINLAVLLLIIALLSVPLATDRSLAWAGFIEFAKVILMFIILVNVLRTETRLRLLIHLILVVSCWMSIAAVNDYRLGRFSLPGERIEGIIGGLFDNPNDMALHLVTMIPITLALFWTSRHLLGKVIYPICMGLMVAGVVASFSRGGFLGLICATAFMVWRLARKNRTLFLVIAIIFFVGFVALSPGDFQTRLATTGDASSIQRQNDLKRSLFVALHHPLFGVGINNYRIYSNTEHATHNAYTQVGAELGLPAMIIYLMFLLAALKPLREIGNETKQTDPKSRFRYLAAGFEASLVGYMVASFFASVAFLWYLYYLVGYGICLARLYHAAKPLPALENAGAGPRLLRGDHQPSLAAN